MPVREKADLAMASNAHEEALAAVLDIAKQTAPMVQRLASHRGRIEQAIKELDSERFELISRRDHLRRQIEAVESGFAMHLEDIDATLKLYEGGTTSLGEPSK